jgi:hypothetical protein
MEPPKTWWDKPANFSWSAALWILASMALQAALIAGCCFGADRIFRGYGGTVPLFFWGPIQLAVTLPLGYALKKKGQAAAGLAVLIWGGVCVLLWGGCYGIVFLGNKW